MREEETRASYHRPWSISWGLREQPPFRKKRLLRPGETTGANSSATLPQALETSGGQIELSMLQDGRKAYAHPKKKSLSTRSFHSREEIAFGAASTNKKGGSCFPPNNMAETEKADTSSALVSAGVASRGQSNSLGPGVWTSISFRGRRGPHSGFRRKREQEGPWRRKKPRRETNR